MSQKQQPRATKLNRSRVWVYFKKCDGDKVRCNLCSLELNIHKTNNTRTILWNHIKFKHSSINDGKNLDDLILNDQDDIFINELQLSSLQRKTRANSNDKPYTTVNNNNNNNNMTPTKLNRTNDNLSIGSKLTTKSNTNSKLTNKNPRQQDLINDFIVDYNELNLIDTTTTSMKPLPSSSISRNLISRLNQFSTPVTRKLKFWNKKSFQVNQYDPSFKVIYLGNLGMQLWSKDESCLEKPLSTLWNNYLVNMKTEIVMRLTICNSGLKAITRQHGLTQYWSNRLVYCCSHKNYPKIFSWVYRHEGKKMRQELRCHAVFCPSPEKATKMATLLNERLACALQEFRREKKSRGGITNIVISNCYNYNSNTNNSTNINGCNIDFQQQKLPRTIPLRRQILAKGTANFRPPLERSKSAPKLTSIQEEDYDLEDEDDDDDDDQVSQEEFEFEESFGDKDDESDYDEEVELGKYVDVVDDNVEEEDLTHKIESNSLATTVNEETSNSSSVCATIRDSSYDNNKQQSHNYGPLGLGGISTMLPVAPNETETNQCKRLLAQNEACNLNNEISNNQQSMNRTKELDINYYVIKNSSTSSESANIRDSCQDKKKNQISSANINEISSLEQHVVSSNDKTMNISTPETDNNSLFRKRIDSNEAKDNKLTTDLDLDVEKKTILKANQTTSIQEISSSTISNNDTDINSNDKRIKLSKEELAAKTTTTNRDSVTDENFTQEIILPWSNLVIK